MKTTVQAMPDSIREKIVAFICGNVSTMSFTLLKIPNEFVGMGWKIVATLLVGMIGGIAGVAGKDIYGIIKRKLFVTKKIKR